jgi:hypothetical protein
MLGIIQHQPTENRLMPSIRHTERAVDSLLTSSDVALPLRTRRRLLFFILGILLSGTLVLRRIASTHAYLTPQTTCAASHERRLRRVINDPLITWERSYARVVRRMLARQRPRRWVIIIDETAQAEHLRVLTAALWYRGRAIPLAWLCWPGQTKQTINYWARCGTLLAMVRDVLPADAAVVVVADRAFGCPVFTDLVTLQLGTQRRYSAAELREAWPEVKAPTAESSSLAWPEVEHWLGNLQALIGDGGLPRRVKPTSQTGKVLLAELEDSSLARYIVAKGLATPTPRSRRCSGTTASTARRRRKARPGSRPTSSASSPRCAPSGPTSPPARRGPGARRGRSPSPSSSRPGVGARRR